MRKQTVSLLLVLLPFFSSFSFTKIINLNLLSFLENETWSENEKSNVLINSWLLSLTCINWPDLTRHRVKHACFVSRSGLSQTSDFTRAPKRLSSPFVCPFFARSFRSTTWILSIARQNSRVLLLLLLALFDSPRRRYRFPVCTQMICFARKYRYKKMYRSHARPIT